MRLLHYFDIKDYEYFMALYPGQYEEPAPGLSETLTQYNILFFLSSFEKYTPLEHCCVGLSPGSREAKVQCAQVCLNCTKPSVARSSYWSLPVGRYLSNSRCKASVMILARWTASDMADEPQTTISYQVRKWRTTTLTLLKFLTNTPSLPSRASQSTSRVWH